MTAIEKLQAEYLTEADIAKLLGITLKTLRNRKSERPGDVPPITVDGLCHMDDFRAWQRKRRHSGAVRR